MPETTNTFRNIISVVAEATSTQQALLDIFTTLKSIQVAARETGMVLDQLLAKQAALNAPPGGGAPPAAGAGGIMGRVQAIFRDITMGGQAIPFTPGAGTNPDIMAQIAAATGAASRARPDVGQGEWITPAMRAQEIAKTAVMYSQMTGASARTAFGQIQGQMAPDPYMSAQLAVARGGLGSTAVTNWTDPKEIDKLAQSLGKVDESAARAGRSFGTVTTHILTGMFVWQGVNLIANTLINTFDGLVKNYRATDDAAAKLSATMGIGKDVALGYTQGLAMTGAQYGIGVTESLAAGGYAARVQKEPGQRQQLFDISAQLAVRTGEDQLKLMDNLNVAARQSGLSYTQLGDMASRAFDKTGTSATEALNTIRELGPLAQASGIDINQLFEIVVKSADRMGGSASDATNSWTRLWKAVTEPNQAQLEVLNKYGIKLGQDINTMMAQVAAAPMTAEDIGKLSGRPGMPAAANDMRTLVGVMREFHGELGLGPGLQEQYAKSIESTDFSLKRFFATLQANMGLTAQMIGAGFDQKKMMQLLGYDEATIAKVQGKFADFQAERERANRQAAGQLYRTETGAVITPPAPTPPAPPRTPELEIYNRLMSGLAKIPETPTDLTKYTTAEMGGIAGKGKQQEEAWIESLSKFYDAMKVDPKKKEELLSEAKQSIETFIAVFKTPQGLQIEYGAEAYYKQQNLAQQQELINRAPMTGTDISQYTDVEVQKALSDIPAIQAGIMASWRRFYQQMGLSPAEVDSLVAAKQEAVQNTVAAFQSGANMTIASGATAAYLPQALQKASREQALEDRLKELRESLDDLNETTKKAQKLEGLWNIPVGARILAPFAGKALEPEPADTGDEARRQRQREKIEEEIRRTEEELQRLKNAGAAALVPPSAPPQPRREEPLMPRKGAAVEEAGKLALPSDVAQTLAMLNAPLNNFSAAVGKFDAATSKWMGSGKGPTFEQGQGIDAFKGLGQLASPMVDAMKQMTIEIKPQPVQIHASLTIGLDKAVLAQQMYDIMAPDLINQARIQGVLSQ